MAKVIVTGGCGIIGREVVNVLLSKNYDVTVIDNLSKPESKVEQGYEFKNVDLTNLEETKKAFEGADYCIHMAAKLGGLAYLQKYPATILHENNLMYASVFEAALKAGLKRVVYISSGMVFEQALHFPSKESELKSTPVPFGYYGFSKLVGEWYCRSFCEEFGLEYGIVRLFNVYGSHDAVQGSSGSNHVIPELIAKVISGQYPVEIFGTGQQIRTYTHIRDAAEGIVAVMEHPSAKNEDFNISSGEEITILDLVKKIWTLSGNKKEFKFTSIPALKNDTSRRTPNVSKAETVLNWKAKILLDEGLKETIEGIRKQLRK